MSSGQDFSDPMGPATVQTSVMSQSQAMLDHAVEWIADRGLASKTLTLSWYGGTLMRIHLDEPSDVRHELAGTGARLVRELHGANIHVTAYHDGMEFTSCCQAVIGDTEGDEIL